MAKKEARFRSNPITANKCGTNCI